MAAPTLEQQLEAVENAIYALTTSGAQSYTINGRAMTRADLNQLREWRRELKREIVEAASGGSGFKGRTFFKADR
ncbi:MAG TPA: hypothetical protein ENK02_02650 [Planctomycetes bacterium]|nr:hypothetical protein [Planctomycetota bacterium]